MCFEQVGEACVGKTTLAKNLFAAYCREGDPAIQDGPHTVQQFTEAPEAGCTDIEVQVQPEDSDTVTSFHYCIQASHLKAQVLPDDCMSMLAALSRSNRMWSLQLSECVGLLMQSWLFIAWASRSVTVLAGGITLISAPYPLPQVLQSHAPFLDLHLLGPRDRGLSIL